MKILILHQHFKTPEGGGAVRSYYLAKALADAGHNVLVITSHNEKRYTIVNVEGIEVHYLSVPYDNRYSFYQRIKAFRRFAFGASRLAMRFDGIEMCYAISVPLTVGLIARWLKIRKNLPYIFEVGDLWPEAPIQLGFIKNPLLKIISYRLEKSIYKHAEKIVALSPAIKSAIEDKGLNKRVEEIPNMADCDFFHPTTKAPELETKFGTFGKFVVSYIGALGIANGLEYFLECANVSRKSGLPIQFIICGDGAMKDTLKTYAARLSLSNISFVEFTNRKTVKELLSVSDASFVCYKNIPILETGSPNKFFDGLAAGKLIIINFRGWIKNEIEINKCGIFVDPKNPVDFIKQIEPFLRDDKLLSSYQHASRELGERKYSRKKLSRKFRDLFS